MHLSVVTTMYNSAAHLAEFHERASRAARQLDEDYELIFVNDGSPDDSLDIALALRERDDHVKVIDLSRNFGHHKAIMTGLSHAGASASSLLTVTSRKTRGGSLTSRP